MTGRSSTIRRILREVDELSKCHAPDYTASPLEDDLFEWHFTYRGPPNSPYADGIYHGRIVLPPLYPLRPPSFRFLTPSGRFEVNREICLSISGHHEETWQPAWGLRTALVALRSFMETDAQGQLGGLDAPESVRKRFAAESGSFRCPSCAKTNRQIINECEELYKESSAQDKAPVEIPSELKMGWRDEMPVREDTAPNGLNANPVPTSALLSTSTTGSASDTSMPRLQPDTELAELAEGFVRTVPSHETTEKSGGAPSSLPGVVPTTSATPTTRSVVGPVGTAGQPSRPQQALNAQARQTLNGEGVSLWIDRAIVALIVVLIALLLKVFTR